MVFVRRAGMFWVCCNNFCNCKQATFYSVFISNCNLFCVVKRQWLESQSFVIGQFVFASFFHYHNKLVRLISADRFKTALKVFVRVIVIEVMMRCTLLILLLKLELVSWLEHSINTVYLTQCNSLYFFDLNHFKTILHIILRSYLYIKISVLLRLWCRYLSRSQVIFVCNHDCFLCAYCGHSNQSGWLWSHIWLWRHMNKIQFLW